MYPDHSQVQELDQIPLVEGCVQFQENKIMTT